MDASLSSEIPNVICWIIVREIPMDVRSSAGGIRSYSSICWCRIRKIDAKDTVWVLAETSSIADGVSSSVRNVETISELTIMKSSSKEVL